MDSLIDDFHHETIAYQVIRHITQIHA